MSRDKGVAFTLHRFGEASNSAEGTQRFHRLIAAGENFVGVALAVSYTHLESRNLPAQDRKAAKGRPVFLLQRSRFSESIQILQVAPLVQELLAVVLPVDIEELPAQLP